MQFGTASSCDRWTCSLSGSCSLLKRNGTCLAQVSAIKQNIAELRAGLKKAETEIGTTQRLKGNGEGSELMEAFANSMAAFHDSAAASVKATEVCPPAAEELLWLSNSCNACRPMAVQCIQISKVQTAAPRLPTLACNLASSERIR